MLLLMTREFTPPPALQPLLVAIAADARAGGVDAYVVGGSVRDALLGRPMRDLDIAVDRDAVAFARRLADEHGGRYLRLDDERSVARVVLAAKSDTECDEGGAPPARTPAVAARVAYIDVAQLHGALAEDLRSRDFTIDALAVPLGGDAVIDVCGGLADLSARRVRMNGVRVFDADPLRLLRAFRLAAQLGFAIEPATLSFINRPASNGDAIIFALPACMPGLAGSP